MLRIPKNHTWFRLHRAEHTPIHFGATKKSRFDAPDESYAVLYIARQLRGAFVETVCCNSSTLRPIAEAELNRYHVATITALKGLKLVDLAGKGLLRMGLDSRLTSGDYRIAQRWSAAFYQHPDKPDGILYVARHDPKQQAVALFDRAKPLLKSKKHNTMRKHLGDHDYFALLDHYGVALL